jgi:tRNA dimethylallyltransferase
LSGASAGVEIHVICGPTAAGKSAVAMWLAGDRSCTIISADSRQIYRGFDVGTAKPSREERARVPHRGIDVADPTERYSAAAWAGGAHAWIGEARAEGRTPVVVGGTGLYLRALFHGLFEEPPLDVERRRMLEATLGAMRVEELTRWTAVLDPARAHLGRTQLIRAIEIALLSGQRLSALHRASAPSLDWRPRYLVVDPGPALAGRIEARIDDMLAHGWPDEVRQLMQTVPADAPAWKSTGYDAIRRLLQGRASPDEARAAVVVATRQYAKRQRTWFRHQLRPELVTHVNPLAPEWRSTVLAWMSNRATVARRETPA